MISLKRLTPFIRPHLGRLAQAGACMALVAASQTLIVYLLKPVVDEVFVSKSEAALWMVVWMVPSVMAVKSLASYIQSYLMHLVGQRIAQKLREDLFRQINALSLDYFWDKRSGELMSRVTADLGLVQTMLTGVPLSLVRDGLTVVGLMGVLFYLHWRFAAACLLILPIGTALGAVLSRKMRRASADSQTQMATLYHRFSESLQGLAVVKAFHYEEGALKRFREENQSYFNHIMRFYRAAFMAAPLMEFLGGLGAAGLVFFGGRETLAHHMSAGDFFAFMGAFLAAYNPLKNISSVNAQVQQGLAGADRVFAILDAEPSVREARGAAPLRGLTREIALEGVSFRYPAREQRALEGLNLKIRAGEAVAFVGPSGSGKSTLVNLLLRLADPSEGRVLLDGNDLRQVSFRSLREATGLVTQDTVLFNDSVLANVLLGREASREDVEAACRAADALDFIRALPQGLDTPLGDRGQRLSGGQRQRLAIARAILKNPVLLVLDEATSNLDTASERAVQGALERLLHTRTVVMVAHRLSTIQNADRIFVLQDGRVAESGEHRTLLASGGLYRRLYESQQAEAGGAKRSEHEDSALPGNPGGAETGVGEAL